METFRFEVSLNPSTIATENMEQFKRRFENTAIIVSDEKTVMAYFDLASPSQPDAIVAAVSGLKEEGIEPVEVRTYSLEEYKLYHWDSVKTMAGYRPGNAAIMARNIEQARFIFELKLWAWLKEEKEWLFLDSDLEEDVEEQGKIIASDVEAQPRIITDALASVLVRGSD